MFKMETYQLSIRQKILKAISLLIIFVNVSFTGQVLADEVLNKPAAIYKISDDWIRATDDELAQQRGGFVLPNGMVIDISLERTILLNGVETISSFFQFPENGILLQNGSENLMPDPIGSALSSVIQNNLDDQVIKAISEFNIELSNLQNINVDNHHHSLDSILPMLQ
jgi:hypothetical protein